MSNTVRKLKYLKTEIQNFILFMFATMISFVRNITLKVFSFAMIAIIGLLIANKAVYTHSHKLLDGSVYTHSHPYNKSHDSQPYKSHHHTNAEFLFLNNLTLLFFSLFLVIVSSFIIKEKQTYFNRGKIYFRLFSRSNFGRAPPVS